jgi:hypothetical protein
MSNELMVSNAIVFFLLLLSFFELLFHILAMHSFCSSLLLMEHQRSSLASWCFFFILFVLTATSACALTLLFQLLSLLLGLQIIFKGRFPD